MSGSPVSTPPATPNRRATSPVCPPAPRRSSRSASDAAEIAAYEEAIRALAGDLQTRLDQSAFLDGSPVLVAAAGVEGVETDEPLPEPSPILERQRALGTGSPTNLFILGVKEAIAAVALEVSPIVSRRETDIEGDVNVSESESDETETDVEAAVEEGEVEGEETETESGAEADIEETNTGPDSSSPPPSSAVSSPSAETTGGLHLTMHRQGHAGHLAMGIEAPLWMWVFLAGMITSYMWLIVAFFAPTRV